MAPVRIVFANKKGVAAALRKMRAVTPLSFLAAVIGREVTR
jgi:hypothetical protein